MTIIPGYSNYMIDTDGNVFSKLSCKMLKPGTYVNGYKYVQIRGDNGILRNERVHLLIALTYMPPEHGKPQVHHKDENKANNRLDNLERCNGHYNQQQSAYKKHKVVEMLDMNNNVVATFESVKAAAHYAGYSSSTISKACRGLRITSLNKWRFASNDKD